MVPIVVKSIKKGVNEMIDNKLASLSTLEQSSGSDATCLDMVIYQPSIIYGRNVIVLNVRWIE